MAGIGFFLTPGCAVFSTLPVTLPDPSPTEPSLPPSPLPLSAEGGRTLEQTSSCGYLTKARLKTHYPRVSRSPKGVCAEGDRKGLTPEMIKLWARVGISFIVLASALFVILSGRYDESAQKWAYASVGIVLGFWLNTP